MLMCATVCWCALPPAPLIIPSGPAARCRLVQGKEKGATIEVDGEKVALGIPQARS